MEFSYSNLIQVKIRNSKGYDIIKSVYMDEKTLEINIVEEIEPENFVPDKENFINKVFTAEDEEFDTVVKYFHLIPYASVYYNKHARRMVAYRPKTK